MEFVNEGYSRKFLRPSKQLSHNNLYVVLLVTSTNENALFFTVSFLTHLRTCICYVDFS